MLTRLPLSLMVELAVDCSTKYSVPSALMNSEAGFSSAMILPSACGPSDRSQNTGSSELVNMESSFYRGGKAAMAPGDRHSRRGIGGLPLGYGQTE